MNINTTLAQAGIIDDESAGAISTPIYQTATFICRKGVEKKYEYTRTGNPTREALEKVMADIEGGAGSCAFSSGMAAVTAVMSLFSSGDRIIASDDLYGGTFRLFGSVFNRFGITITYADTTDLDAIEKAIDKTVKAIFIETPSNPTMKIADIKSIAEFAGKRKLKCIVDNTFMTPYFQKPVELGADIVVHSGTKFLGGHNDTLCGIVVCASADDYEQIKFIQNTTGGVLSPHDSWLILRGIKTLGVRLDRAQANSEKIAHWLLGRKEIKDVYYPGIDGFKGKSIHGKQSSGNGVMLSFRTRDAAIAEKLIYGCRVLRFAESLGGVETLITRPSTQTHSFMPEELRARLGITDTLLRLSVGIEDAADLIDDIKRTLEA